LIDKFRNTKSEAQIKFTNPLRKYKDLLANRIVNSLIGLEKLAKQEQLSKKKMKEIRRERINCSD
jgi:exoribonuclease II